MEETSKNEQKVQVLKSSSKSILKRTTTTKEKRMKLSQKENSKILSVQTEQFLNFSEEQSQKTRARKKNILIQINKSDSLKIQTSQEFLAREKSLSQKKSSSSSQVLSVIHKTLLKDLSADLKKLYLRRIYEGVSYSLNCLREPSMTTLEKKARYLYEPVKTNKKFLILDLDETLIQSEEPEESSEGFSNYKVKIRPYTFRFLTELSDFFQIYVFTAATKGYATSIISRLNRDREFIKDKLTREDCLLTKKGSRIKDLRIIKNRELRDIVIVDNLVESFGFQINNGCPIPDFIGQEGDRELLRLIPFLKELSGLKDVRPAIKERYQLEKLKEIKAKDIQRFISKMKQ